jgi:hypothetical protein
MDMTITQTPEVAMTEPVKAVAVPVSDLSFKNEDFAEDMARLQTAVAMTAVKPVETPAIPATAEAPKPDTVTEQKPANSEVPEKFKTPDGKLDEGKVEKSLINVEQALKTYQEKQKELNRLITETKAKENAYLKATPLSSVPVTTPPADTSNLSFEQQIEADLQKEGTGKVLSKLFNAAREAALDQFRGEITPLQETIRESQTSRQVEAIGKTDPWVYTPEGIDTLTKILNDKPYMQSSDNPYRDAYIYYQGAKLTASRVDSQVLTPTPTAKASAPVPTASAANHTSAPVVRLDSRESIEKALQKLTPKEQSEFFVKQGLPAF